MFQDQEREGGGRGGRGGGRLAGVLAMLSRCTSRRYCDCPGLPGGCFYIYRLQPTRVYRALARSRVQRLSMR